MQYTTERQQEVFFSMILAIDVGNTNIVLGCIEDGDIRSIVRIQTNPGETAAEYAIKLMP